MTSTAVVGILLIGYGFLPLAATDMRPEEKIEGVVMLASGFVCLYFAFRMARRSQR